MHNTINAEQLTQSDVLEDAMSGVAAAMSDPSRVKILCALMDGRAWTATELAAVTDVASSTASAHLNRLLTNKLIICLSQGRHRYYRLAGKETAELIEMMMGISWQLHPTPATKTPVELRMLRTCYDHLAGEIAVKIYDAMNHAGWFGADGTFLTDEGFQQFRMLGIVLEHKTKRKICCGCLDWSERRFHLGGEAGAQFFALCEHKHWVQKVAGFRKVNMTSNGRKAIGRLFHIEF